ncbi:hypothetical protein PF004_g31136, partial [Phytophthora fragariae]
GQKATWPSVGWCFPQIKATGPSVGWCFPQMKVRVRAAGGGGAPP